MKKNILLLAIFLLATIASEALAIPAFARKYSMTCKTCHSPFPRLKEYGEEFAGNGFILKDKEAPRFFMETGDEELSLIRDFPLAMRIEGYITQNHEQSKGPDLYVPHSFKILSGANLGGNVAYYLYYILEEGKPGKLEDAFILFSDVLGSGLGAAIGQFQVCDPIAKRELRLSRDDYMVLKAHPGSSGISLAYDRGVMLTYGLPTGTDLVFQVVNGNGIGSTLAFDNFDSDKHKNFFVMAMQDVAGLFTLGGNLYIGKEDMGAGASTVTSSVNMYGGNVVTSFGPFDLTGVYLFRKDKGTLVGPATGDIETSGGFAELIYLPNGDDSKWYVGSLFNIIDSDDPATKLKTVSAFTGYQVRRNIRLTGEFRQDLNNKYGMFAFGFVAAF